jgi:Uncharacterized protein conserved in bacteria (DUF2247)
MTNPLDVIASMGIPVTWPVVQAGWDGIGQMDRQLTVADISDFACKQLERLSADASADILDLCAATDSDEVNAVLPRLAPVISRNAIRTWRAVLLAKLLDELPGSPVDGLSELTSFWNTLNFPDDMPHVVQGRDNDISPVDYYTEKNYQQTIGKHRDWLRSEIAELARGDQP